MPFFNSLPEDAGPPHVFRAYPELHRHWSDMSQVLMNGSSPLSPAEREMILAFAADVAGCPFAYIAHCGVAYAWGVEEGLIDKPLDDLADAPVEVRLKPLLAFVRKLTLKLSEMTPATPMPFLTLAGRSRRCTIEYRLQLACVSCSAWRKVTGSNPGRRTPPENMPNSGSSWDISGIIRNCRSRIAVVRLMGEVKPAPGPTGVSSMLGTAVQIHFTWKRNQGVAVLSFSFRRKRVFPRPLRST